jgi:hypothetical protein
LVDLLKDFGGPIPFGFYDGGQDLFGMFVAGLDPFQVEDREAPHLPESDREIHVHHAVHRAGEDRNGVALPVEGPGGIHFVGIKRDGAGD